MQTDLVYRHQRAHRAGWKKLALGILGGTLYIIMALAIMQVAFRVWVGMW